MIKSGNLNFKERLSLLFFLLCSLLVLVGTNKLLNERITIVHDSLSTDLLGKANFLSRTINPLEINPISFHQKSLSHSEFVRLQDQLRNYHNYLNVENTYTLIRDDSKIMFGPAVFGHQEQPTLDEIPPRIQEQAEHVFNTGKPAVASPLQFSNWNFISALVPVLDLRSGEVLMVVGLDQNTNHLTRALQKEKRFVYFFGAIFLLIFTLGFIFTILRNKNQYRDSILISFSGVFITGALGLASTLFVALLFLGLEKNKHRDTFAQLSHPHASRIVEMFNGFHDNDLLPIIRLFEMNDNVSREDFDFFTSQIYRRFRMAGVGWAPKVKHSERNTFVNRVRNEFNDEFNFFRNVPFLGKAPLEPKDIYFPLLFVEPYEEIHTAIGLDLHTDSLRWEAIYESIQTGLPSITDRILRFSNNEPSFNVYAPIYNLGQKPDYADSFQQKLENLLGVVYITLRLNAVLSESVYEQPNENASLLIDLYQLESNNSKTLLASSYNQQSIQTHGNLNEDLISEKVSFTHTYPLFVFGKTYIIVIQPGSAFYVAHPKRLFWLSLSIGLLLTLLFIVVHLFATRRKIYLESLLTQRSSALEENRQKLQQLNEHFESIAKQSLTVLWEVDADGLITYVSDLAKKVIGYKPSDLIKKKFIWEIMPEERSEKFRTFIIDAFIRKIEFSDLEGSLFTCDKRWIWVALNGIPILDPQNQLRGYRGALSDITERKKALDAQLLLRQKEEQRILLDNIQTQIWYLTEYNAYGAVNKAHADFLGVSAANIMFRNIYDVIPKEMADAFCRGNIQVFQSGKNLNIEVWVPHVSGKRLISIYKHPKINTEGKVDYVVCSAEDITEQRKAEEALKVSKERYRTLAENAFEGIYLLYGRHFEYVNEKFCEIIGYEKHEVTSEFFDFNQVLTQKSQEIVEGRYKARLDGKQLPNIYEFEIITKKGVIKQVEISTNSLISKDKPRILGIMRDITERNHAQKLEQEVAIARKSAQFKQNFLANMSHEIRTPLTGVLGMTEMLAKTQLDSRQKDFVNVLYQSGENLKEIINLILDYSKIEAGKVKLSNHEFAPGILIKNAQKLFAGLCSNEVKLETWISDDVPPQIIADRQRLSQVVNNLLSNAIKFTEKGSISVKIYKDTNSQAVKHSSGEMLKVEITDSGPGIRDEIQKKLFVPFYQIDQDSITNIEGTGLGLAISKDLVTLLGGQIGVISQEGKGSTFWFTFKAQIPNGKENSIVEIDKPKKYELGKSLKILLVEDKVVNQKVISLMMESLQHKVTLAENGEHALQIYPLQKFDLILMDIKMPVMDGITATNKLKESFSGTPPIIGLSASSFEGDREKYMGLGMDEYLTKPLDLDAFILLMKKMGLF